MDDIREDGARGALSIGDSLQQHVWRELNQGWTVSIATPATPQDATRVPASVPAQVPGCVHTDLLTADLIADPYLDLNELDVDWIGRQTWRYETTFSWDGDEPVDGTTRGVVDLVCDGLDTVATVLVNGTEVGRTANMHRSYRFTVTELLTPGENHLAVVFDSAWDYTETLQRELGGRPNAYPTPFNFIRKMACNFGWDWGPTLVTAGIWKPIGLQTWHLARLEQVRPMISVDDDGTGRAQFLIDLQTTPAGSASADLRLVASVGDYAEEFAVPVGQRTAEIDVLVPDADLWWPHSLGEQPLYPAQVQLFTANGVLLESWQRRIGFRNVALNTSLDETGRQFAIEVNGVPIFVRGANWIPDDCFLNRVTAQRYRARVLQAKEANLDLLRIWGGGIYESDTFYEICDELGIMVWQDFLFACAAYPQESPLREEVEAEARENVARLTPHPSLVLWNGNNENIWGWFDWEWQAELGERTWGLGYYLDLLPAVVAEVDPSRPYWPGSPYSGSMDVHPNDFRYGNSHIWDVWNEVDYSVYRSQTPRFVSEFGFQGPPTWSTLTRALHDEPLLPDSAGMLHHQRAADGNAKLERGLAPRLPVPTDMVDWHFLTQLNQARAIGYGIEHFRSLRPHCMGTIVWQLNDCWPVTSWAAIDGDGRLKPLWYALRAANRPRLLTLQPRPEGLTVFTVNDGRDPWHTTATIRRITLDGTVLAEQTAHLAIPARSQAAVVIDPEVATPGDPEAEILVATATSGERSIWYFVEDLELAYPSPDLEISLETTATGVLVSVAARTFVRDLCLFVDRLDPAATVDEQLVTLLPGERTTFTITSSVPLDEKQLSSTPVLRSVNDVLTTISSPG